MDDAMAKKIVDVMLEFNRETGVSITDILKFYKKLSDLNSEFAIQVVRDELKKITA